MIDDEIQQVFDVIVRLRKPMLKAHPEWLTGCVSDVLECALCIEKWVQEIEAHRQNDKGFTAGAQWQLARDAKIAEGEPDCYDAGCTDIQKTMKDNLAIAIRQQYDGSPCISAAQEQVPIRSKPDDKS